MNVIIYYLIITVLSFLNLSLSDFDCINVISEASSTADDETVSISCIQSSYPVLVSCGYRPADTNNFDIPYVDGGWMNSNGTACIARNGGGGQTVGYQTVVAIARYIGIYQSIY